MDMGIFYMYLLNLEKAGLLLWSIGSHYFPSKSSVHILTGLSHQKHKFAIAQIKPII